MGCRRAGRPPAVSGPGGGRTAPHPLSRGPDRAGGGLSLLRRPAGPSILSLYLGRGEDTLPDLGAWAGGWSRSAPARARHPSHTFVAGADNSPVPELAAAELAGVGCRGRHGLRIVPPYGSYVFLGTILTDLVLPSTGPSAETLCPPHCRACQAACPTGALTEQGCEVTRCLSDLTQRKGPLPPEAAEQVRRSPTVWGCDLCQKACPHNQAAALTPLPEFREDLLCSLTLAELEPLSNKAFRRQYARRAFSWRGLGHCAGTWPSRRRQRQPKRRTAPPLETAAFPVSFSQDVFSVYIRLGFRPNYGKRKRGGFFASA